MNIARNIVRRIMKVVMWVILTALFLLIIVIVLIQIPFVQNKIVHAATSFVSSKTDTKVEIENIGISFPGNIVIKGLFLEDQQHDTLLYAGKARVNMAFRNLLKNRIHISSFQLHDVVLNLSRAEGDSLFNHHFLLTAFGDTTTQEVAVRDKSNNWDFAIDRINLKNIRIHFDDAYGGTYAAVDAKQLILKTKHIDLTKSVYNIDDLFVDGLYANILITKSAGPSSRDPESVLPNITTNKIQIINTHISYGDSIIKQSAVAVIDRLGLKNAALDLEQQMITLEKLSLSDSDIQYHTSDRDGSIDTNALTGDAEEETGNWTVSVKDIDLKDNSLKYSVANKPHIKNAFNVNHMVYKHVTLAATDFYYSALKTNITVKAFTAVDQNNFSIIHFETGFSMDPHSITLNRLKLRTPGSFLDADLALRFSSLSSLKDSLPFMKMNVDMRNVSVRTADILYFNKPLEKQDFFQHVMNVTSLSGRLSGSLNSLTGKNLVIKTGTNTILETDFIITGLPEVETAVFSVPNLKATSGKTDIDMMAGSSVPENIELPQTISMDVVFHGTTKDFESTAGLSSSFGSADLTATIDASENFSGKATVDRFNLGLLLKDTLMYGPVSFVAEASGVGLDKNTVEAEVHAVVSQFYLNQYNYQNLDIDGFVSGREFTGNIELIDEYAAFDFDGKVNLNPGQEQYTFLLNVHGANLQQLNFTTEDIRVGFVASADLKGNDINTLNGQAGISKIIVAKDSKIYVLDSLMLASINESGKSEVHLSSALIGINYSGTVSPASIKGELINYMNRFFPFSDSSQLPIEGEPSKFSFEIQLHNHPILSQVLLPQLKEFEPGIIKGSFDGDSSAMHLTATMKKIVYGNTEIHNLEVDVGSDAREMNYSITSSAMTNAQIQLENFLLVGKLADDTLFANLSSIGDNSRKKIAIHSHITRDINNYTFAFDPEEFYLMYDQWNIDADNYISFGKEGLLIHRMYFNHGLSAIHIASLNDEFNDDLNIEIKNFNLSDISRIIEKDTAFVSGIVDGNVLLRRVNDSYGIIADAEISNLILRETPIGNITFSATNPVSGKFDIDIFLRGYGNNLTANG